jgi:hypothetical protein
VKRAGTGCSCVAYCWQLHQHHQLLHASQQAAGWQLQGVSRSQQAAKGCQLVIGGHSNPVRLCKNQYAVPKKVSREMMASFNKSLDEDVLTAFPITLDVELLCISKLLPNVECELGATKRDGRRLCKLCQQLPPLLPKGQEWQVVEYLRVPGAPRWKVQMRAGACL